MPTAGKLNKLTLPVATLQVGASIFPMDGAEGVGGIGFMVKLADGGETHPVAELVTV